MPVSPTVWFCYGCLHGPMSTINDLSCSNCDARRSLACKTEGGVEHISDANQANPPFPNNRRQPLPAPTSRHVNRARGKGRKREDKEKDDKKAGPDPNNRRQPLPASTSRHVNRARGKGRKWKDKEKNDKKAGPDYNEKSMGENLKEAPSSTDQPMPDSADVDTQRFVNPENLILPEEKPHSEIESSSDDGQEWAHEYSAEWLETAAAESPGLQSIPDIPLPPGLDRDEDLLLPSAWINKIKAVEARIAANSTLQTYTSTELIKEKEDGPSIGFYPRIKFPAQRYEGYDSLDSVLSRTLETYIKEPTSHHLKRVRYDVLLSRWMKRVPKEDDHQKRYKDAGSSFTELHDDHVSGKSESGSARERLGTLLRDPTRGRLGTLLRDLLESRNLLIKVCLNVTDLQQNGLCHDFISLIVEARNRRRVANLMTIDIDQITSLTKKVDDSVHAIIWGLETGIFPDPDDTSSLRRISLPTITNHLDRIVDTIINRNSFFGLQKMVAISLTSAHLLNLSVLTYCGAHVEAIDCLYLQREVEQFEYYNGHLPANEGIIMRRRSLSCLDTFLHGNRPWVFHSSLERGASNWDGPPMYLSTSVEAFADTWGPVWKTVHVDQSQSVFQRYDVGMGSIVPWSAAHEEVPKVFPNETLCHWTSSSEEIAGRPLFDAEERPRLLIGAAPLAFIRENADCKSTPDELVLALEDKGCLTPWGTTKPQKCRDASNRQIQFGSHGLVLGYQQTYKYIKGTTHKERLVSHWRNAPDQRNPTILGKWLGLEVSLCTMNAQRRRLFHILGSTTCRNLLRKGAFEWRDPRCEQGYYHAISSNDYRVFCKIFRDHKDWRHDLGRAVSWCLEELLSTGVTDGHNLTVLYAPASASDRSIMIRHKEQSWVGFFKDTEISATMAIASEVCLEFEHPLGQRCRRIPSPRKQYSAFQTMLAVNAAASPKEEPYVKGQKLSLMSSGALKVLAPLPHGGVLAQWSGKVPVITGWQDMVSGLQTNDRNVVRYREREEDDEPARIQAAIPVVVVSRHENRFQSRQTTRASCVKTEPCVSSSNGHDTHPMQYQGPRSHSISKKRKHSMSTEYANGQNDLQHATPRTPQVKEHLLADSVIRKSKSADENAAGQHRHAGNEHAFQDYCSYSDCREPRSTFMDGCGYCSHCYCEMHHFPESHDCSRRYSRRNTAVRSNTCA